MTRKVDRHSQIGLDRVVRLDWLERTASLVLAGNSELVIKETLQHEVSKSFRTKDTSVCGSISKTIRVLYRVWVSPPTELKKTNKKGLELLTRLPSKNHMAVHWGMIMAVYPFWANVAIQTGRLLRLQSNVTALQVQRRIREQYGERETVARRARYVLRSYISWGALVETEKKGLYKAPMPLAVDNDELMLWLTEAYLLSQINSSVQAKELFENPVFFPFNFKVGSLDSLFVKSDTIELIRHGLDEIYVMLKN
jgi:hypothetical protein